VGRLFLFLLLFASWGEGKVGERKREMESVYRERGWGESKCELIWGDEKELEMEMEIGKEKGRNTSLERKEKGRIHYIIVVLLIDGLG